MSISFQKGGIYFQVYILTETGSIKNLWQPQERENLTVALKMVGLISYFSSLERVSKKLNTQITLKLQCNSNSVDLLHFSINLKLLRCPFMPLYEDILLT